MNSFLSCINGGFRSRPSSVKKPAGGFVPTSSGSVDVGSASVRVCKYDVFISFRGADTRNTFVDHLYNHLIRKGIFTFKDDNQLHKGELISSQLVQAIKESRVSIVIFSKDYANSSWCLDEMATISQCQQELNLTVFPVFYDVDPSHVRKQIGVYQNAFVEQRKRFEQEPIRVWRWRKAMTDLANLAGWDIRNKPEFEEIRNIVEAVIKTLGHKFSGFANDLVGIQPQVGELERILKLNSQNGDFRVLGIWGMGGIGKTTYATALYDRISYQFDACCFVENVSKIYKAGGAIAVHKQILRQTFDERNLEAYSAIEVSGIVRNRIHNIRLLLILDDVDEFEQLEKLAIDPKLLSKGSRMIITTRDEHILKVYGADTVHKVRLLNDKDARDLFLKKVLKNEDQSSSYVELIPEVLKYTQCLPLAITVMGSFLCTRDAIQWKDALNRLRNNPNSKIMDVLQTTIDILEHDQKEIFLHIACFFSHERVDYVKRILSSCGLLPHIGIQSMVEKSLITIKDDEIHMHEILQELGKKIVRDKYLNNPGCWSRLWIYDDFHHVVTTETGTDSVEAIVLNPKESFSKSRVEGLSKMKNLKLLILYHKNFSGNLNFLSNNLRYLLWHGYPFASLPPTFEPYFLMELNMPNSNLRQLWEGHKDLHFLKRMDLSNSKYLVETPDFSGTPKLQQLDLSGCTNLLKVHPSVAFLTKLTTLSLRNCTSLLRLDFDGASELSSLKVLCLSGCTKLESTPDFTVVSSLEYLEINGCTSLHTVNESIGALESLRVLSLRDCTNLFEMPNNIHTMTSLITLDLNGCVRLTNLPPLPWTPKQSSHLKSLVFLDVGFCQLRELPDAIMELRCLERLNLQGNSFDHVPLVFDLLPCLAYLNLAHCYKLQNFPRLPVRSERASTAGSFFKTTTGSRDHRSGLYVFDCPRLTEDDLIPARGNVDVWLPRMLKDPRHFRCGFDIIVPWNWINIDNSVTIPKWFNRRFKGDSMIRIIHCDDLSAVWIGFVFCVLFEVNINPTDPESLNHLSCSPLPHSFYLSFQSEYTEERFDMPLNLKLAQIDGCKYHWIIYISRQHCHFVETGAHITFKARPGLTIKEWGLRMVIKQDFKDVVRIWYPEPNYADCLAIDNVPKKGSSSGLKIQLPYNWLVTGEDEVEISEAKAKENSLSNLGYA